MFNRWYQIEFWSGNELTPISSAPLLWLCLWVHGVYSTWLWNESQVILDRVCTRFSSQIESFIPVQDSILESWSEDRSSFLKENNLIPGGIPGRADIALFFFGFLLSFRGLSTYSSFISVPVRFGHSTNFLFIPDQNWIRYLVNTA